MRKNRITAEQFALFNQEFMALMRAGLTVPDALALASDRPDSPALGKVLERVLGDVRNGMVLSEACARHPDTFERLFVAAVRTAEKTGDLVGVLVRHQTYLRHQVAMRKKISQALTYPVFLLVALVAGFAIQESWSRIVTLHAFAQRRLVSDAMRERPQTSIAMRPCSASCAIQARAGVRCRWVLGACSSSRLTENRARYRETRESRDPARVTRGVEYCSRRAGIRVHVAVETPLTMSRNTQPGWLQCTEP